SHAPRAPTVPDLAVHVDASRAQGGGDVDEVVGPDRETDMVDAPAVPRRGPVGGQEIDERLAEAELDEPDGLVHELEGAAEDVLVELPRRGLVGHAQHDVVEAERLELRSVTHGAAPAAAFRPADARSRGSRRQRRA